MKKKAILIMGLTSTLLFVSCKKEGCTDATATNYNVAATKDDGSCEFATTAPAISAPTYTPTFAGTFGALIAIKTISTTTTPMGPMDTNIGTAVAVFSENGATSFVNAGDIKVDGNSLSIQNNNSYVYMISATNPMGLTFNNTVSWTGAGNTWPSFTATTNQGFSTVDAITTGNPSSSADYTLATTQISNADSVLFVVAGQNTHINKMLPGNATSHTFTAAEMNSLGAGTGIVQIVGLKYDEQTISAKSYYLINETVRTKTVTIE